MSLSSARSPLAFTYPATLLRFGCTSALALGASACLAEECDPTVVPGSERPRELALSLDELSERLTGLHEIPIVWRSAEEEHELSAEPMTMADTLLVEIYEVGPFMQNYGTGSNGCSPAAIYSTVRVQVGFESVLSAQGGSQDLRFLDAARGLWLGSSFRSFPDPFSSRIGGLRILVNFDGKGEPMAVEGTLVLAGESLATFAMP